MRVRGTHNLTGMAPAAETWRSDMPYVATINVPGYLPMDDEPPIFETAQEAWEYLRDERERGEDFAIVSTEDYSETLTELDKRASDKWLVADFERVGTVYGETPGYDGDHDLGLAYSVTWTDETPKEV